MTAVEIDSELMIDRDGPTQGNPTRRGLCDRRMGTTDRDARCDTCGCDSIECPGHFGSIKLWKPVFHPGYVDFIRKVLGCVCANCGQLLREELRDPSKALYKEIRGTTSRRTRFRKVKEACKGAKRCPRGDGANAGCGAAQPEYKAGKELTIIIKFPGQQDGNNNDPEQVLLPDAARRTLAKIPDEDLETMGLHKTWARPEWMVISTLPVAPPPVRPSVQEGDGRRSEDDLTYAYKAVVATNKLLERAEGQRDTQNELIK